MRVLKTIKLPIGIIGISWLASCAVVPTCPNQLLPIVEVQVNNTASAHDDYITTSGFTACRARITNVNKPFGSVLNFPGGVEIEVRNKNLSSDLTVSTTSSGTTTSFFATLPGNGDWLNFFIRGNATTTIDKSTILELATAGVSCNEVVLSRKGLMVPPGAPPIAASLTRPQVEIEIGSVSHLDDYITWSATACRIRWANSTSSSATLNVTLRNMPGTDRLRFANASPAVTATATNVNTTVTLTGGGWVNFWVAGNNGNASVNDKDAVMEAIDGTGQLLTREGLMVRIRKNVNFLTTGERDRYLEAMRDAQQTYNFYTLFTNSHSRNGAGFQNIAHRQAHVGSGFLPWHRAFVMHMERILQASDPSVAIPFWHFDQPSPVMFNPDFYGSNNPVTLANTVILSATNPLRTWNIPGQPVGIRRRTPYGDAGIPGSVTGTGTGVADETATLNRGTTYAAFVGMEGDTHNGAHNNSGNTISWIAGSPAIAPQDPLFYSLHCNIDRLWAKWQRQNNRFDGAQAASYNLQGGHNSSPSIAPIYTEVGGRVSLNRTFGQYAEDTLWPWDNITGTGAGTSITAERPVVAPLTPFPTVAGGILPGARPTVRSTVDFRQLNFAYSDVFPF